MQRVAVVTNEIPEYRYPVFKSLTESSVTHCRFFVSSPADQSCEAARRYLPLKYSKSINLWLTTKHRTTGTTQREQLPIPIVLFKDLISFKPHVIISGDFGLRSLVCWLTARLLNADFVIWSEEISTSASGRSWLQRKMRRFLASRARACLAWGTPACDYLLSLGIESERIFRCEQAVDNETWIRLATELDRTRLRHELEFQGTVFLLVGRMVERKGFRNFIEAWIEATRRIKVPMIAVFVGSGDQEKELKHIVAQNELSNVRFVGRQSPPGLARYYAAADVFVFPSLEDVWGLVVNEALCFGMPVLASKFAGATQELIDRSNLGVVFDPSNIQEFVTRLCELAISPPPIHPERSRSRLDSVTFSRSFTAITAMLNYVSEQ